MTTALLTPSVPLDSHKADIVPQPQSASPVSGVPIAAAADLISRVLISNLLTLSWPLCHPPEQCSFVDYKREEDIVEAPLEIDDESSCNESGLIPQHLDEDESDTTSTMELQLSDEVNFI